MWPQEFWKYTEVHTTGIIGFCAYHGTTAKYSQNPINLVIVTVKLGNDKIVTKSNKSQNPTVTKPDNDVLTCTTMGICFMLVAVTGDAPLPLNLLAR